VRPECETKHKLLETATQLIWEQSYGSVSVDDICEKAGVRKGSFYHFFPSKADLAVAAFEDHWQQSRTKLDGVFSSQLSPLERLSKYCDMVYESQKCQKDKIGKICGCPYSSVGCELSTQDEKIRKKSQEIAERWCKYLEATLRDAGQEGLIEGKDYQVKAHEVFAYVTGVLLQAKIHNNLQPLKNLKSGIFRLIRVTELASTRN
jgi:TetR/AcrR family transcriptional repressor of nem operon